MIKTPEEFQHEDDTARCVEKLKYIGQQYGRAIMRTVIAHELEADQINAGLELAISDARQFLVDGGICENDVEVSMSILRSAIIAEGKTIAVMLSDHAGGIH